MNHVDDETLAMLAVSDVVADDRVAAHLEVCAQCRAEVADLQRVAAVTRSSSDIALVAPPERVWDRIDAEVRGAPDVDARAGREARFDPATPARRVDEPVRTPVPDSAGRPGGRRDRRGTAAVRRRRRTVAGLVAAGIGVVALVVGIGVTSGVVPGVGSGETVVARATLDALPDWSGARGTAELERARDGRLTLVIDVRGGGAGSGSGSGSSSGAGSGSGQLREVWMMQSDLKGLVSVGFLDGDRGRFTVPANMDLARFPVVDVSAERDDGNPEHSGDSIVRGDLHDR